jgi:hypothetical protein
MASEARDFRTIIVGNDEMGALQVDVAIEGVMQRKWENTRRQSALERHGHLEPIPATLT